MILYRAMSYNEYVETIKHNIFQFNHSHKWFSNNLKFIRNRVQDGNFHNLNKSAYKIIVKIEVNDETFQRFKKCGKYEYSLNLENNFKPVEIIKI